MKREPLQGIPMSDQSDSTLKNIGIFSVLQAATEEKFFFLAATFILFLDNCFIGSGQPGIFDLARSKALMDQSNLATKGILYFVGFSFLTGILFPRITSDLFTMLDWIFDNPFSLVSNWFNVNEQVPERPRGHVSGYKLLQHAHKTREKYYLDLLDQYEDDYAKLIRKWREDKVNSFYCLTMFAINLYLGWGASNSLAYQLAIHAGNIHLIWLGLLLLIWLFLSNLLRDPPTLTAYCPSLYEEIKKAEIEEKKRRDELLENRPSNFRPLRRDRTDLD
ncbi:hypothetical protein [Silvimonas iriomotensis]|uniref:hypothetical protein n=1 Tax=Silvimonas iriomotensis TaxID=449662 RepID=UPI001665A53E|nr:hypothetical protein [Silvimonas iriomotensis]